MTGPLEPHFNMCATLQDSRLVRNGTGSQFGVERVIFFHSKTLKFSLFWAEFKRAEVERYDIDTLASTISVIVS